MHTCLELTSSTPCIHASVPPQIRDCKPQILPKVRVLTKKKLANYIGKARQQKPVQEEDSNVNKTTDKRKSHITKFMTPHPEQELVWVLDNEPDTGLWHSQLQ